LLSKVVSIYSFSHFPLKSVFSHLIMCCILRYQQIANTLT